MSLSSPEIKRQILMRSDESGIRKRIEQALENQSMTEGELIEAGNAFEVMVKTKGWAYFESFMLRTGDSQLLLDIVGEEAKNIHTGRCKQVRDQVQYIDQIIRQKNKKVEENADKEKKAKKPKKTVRKKAV